jgi:putative tryptophan/tyrosine transport system substrate-binding protein
MRRRDFIAGLGSAAAWPVAARAQQSAIPVVGYLDGGSLDTSRETVAGVRRGLSEAGYVEGRNMAIEYRWAEDHYDRLLGLADDLVRRQVAVIVASTTPAALAAMAATKSIPIVFQIGTDPVSLGLVPRLNQPGGNVTGVSVLIRATSAKRLELLHELLPMARSIGFLVNPTNPFFAEPETRDLQAAARILGVRLLILNASNPGEFDAAFVILAREGVGGLIIGSDTLFYDHPDQLVALATRHQIPTIYYRSGATAAGGLMSYGADLLSAWRQVGIYTGRILKGEKPADLPLQQSTRIEMVLNLKTAKALGLTVPQSILLRADEVIE